MKKMGYNVSKLLTILMALWGDVDRTARKCLYLSGMKN